MKSAHFLRAEIYGFRKVSRLIDLVTASDITRS